MHQNKTQQLARRHKPLEAWHDHGSSTSVAPSGSLDMSLARRARLASLSFAHLGDRARVALDVGRRRWHVASRLLFDDQESCRQQAFPPPPLPSFGSPPGEQTLDMNIFSVTSTGCFGSTRSAAHGAPYILRAHAMQKPAALSLQGASSKQRYPGLLTI